MSAPVNHAAGLVIDEEAAKKHYQLTEAESVKNVSMWVGSHGSESQTVHVLDATGSKFELQTLIFPPSILQVFMEQVANVIDQKNDCPVETTQFRFSFDVSSGEASVMNNGKSIPVAVVRNSAGQPQWCPEMLCTGFRSSSNHTKKAGAQRITLGAHGIGLKALTSMSKKMRVECVDIERNLYYVQDILDCNTRVMPPTVVTIDNKKNKPPTELKNGGTRFTYTLDYDFYRADGRSLPTDIFQTMNRIFHARAYQVAGYTCVDTWYNGNKLAVRTKKRLAEMYFPDCEFFELKHSEYPEWPLGVGFAPITEDKKTEYISIINGGYITKGVHFKHVVDKVCEDLQARVTKTFKSMTWDKKLVKNNLSVIIIGTLPDLKFAQQVKTDLNMENHTKYFSKFVWPVTYANKAWTIVNAALAERFIGGDAKKVRAKKLGNPDKYTPAKNIGGPNSDLLAFEGDSATSSAITAFSENLPYFNRENIGIILLGGCPMNVQKYMTETKVNGVAHLRPGQKILDNIVWNDFMTIMNLKYDVKYNTPAALKTLNYRHYTNVTDKDLHGMGKIGAIMISNILQFWPELLAVPGFLGYFDSTLIRVFPKNPKTSPVLAFGSQSEFDVWRMQFPDGIVPDSWSAKWYKGMAGHNDEECIHMFRNYNKLRIAYTDDQKAAMVKLAGYFGEDADVRKDLLRLPLAPIPSVPDRRSIEISTYCDYYVREEQQYNLICKLNGVIDGFINAHRKIAWGAMLYKDSADHNKPIKVYQLGGDIAKRCAYHHGNDSICNAIIWMAQDFVGARNIPHLLPLDQMGTRFLADDAGAPRYIDTQCNPIVDAIYPKADRELYDMLIEDGVETTPKYMVPVICMPILETNSLPGTGWSITKLARNYYDHVDNIFRLLDGQVMQKMRPWMPGWRGEVVEIGNTEWTVGKCSWDPITNMVTISELPYRIKVKPYIYGSKKDNAAKVKAEADDSEKAKKITCLNDLDLIQPGSIEDTSSKTQICIKFQLKPGAMDTINANYGSTDFDPLTDYLGLRAHFARGLNFINTDDTVISFPSYEAAMIPWFKERCRMYPLRFERRCILIDLEIEMLRNQIRYIGERAALGVSGKSKVRQIEIIEGAGFRKFNVSKIKSPGVRNDRIAAVVYGDNASFMYLLNISDLDASCEAVEKLHEKIQKLLGERADLSAPGAMRRIWSEEIAEVTRQINIGHTEGWVPKGKYKYE